MSITSITSGASALQGLSQGQGLQRPEMPSKASDAPSFADRMGGALKDVSRAQSEASRAAAAWEAGAEENLASVMISQQVSSLGFQMALNVRNKALGAYRDIMNMPV